MSQLDNDPVYLDINSSASFPYASAYVSTAQQYQAQLAAQQQQVPSIKQEGSDSVKVKESRLSEERKQKYAGDLIGKCIDLAR